MHQHNQHWRWALRLLMPVLGMVLVLSSTLPAHAEPEWRPVRNWVRHNATPLNTVDPAAPLDDLAPLRRSIGDAEIVGLGESVHGAAEEINLKHRALRFLVEQMGFRSIAWEDSWTMGLQINEYIQTGEGDLDALMSQMSPPWQSQQVADVLRWLRDYNVGRTDKVQFVGVEYYVLGQAAYDAVEAYVARVAPERLEELRSHFQDIRPSTPDAWEHAFWYMCVGDKEPYIAHARQVFEMINGLPHDPEDGNHALVLHHAHQIVSFYEHYNLSEADALVYRDAHAAENLRWWREYRGDKIVYWAASPHTANAPQLRIVRPPDPDWSFPSAGSYLRTWYGQRYLSIGFTFDHGTVSLGPGLTADMPQPARDWFERPFGAAGSDQFILDLRAPAPPPVQRWLEASIKTRGLADRGSESYMTGGSLEQWFDVIIHRQEVTPVQPAPPASAGWDAARPAAATDPCEEEGT